MDDFKKQIHKRLIANIIIDKCMQNENIFFRDAWCTQDRIIRFTTPFFRELFSVEENEKGKWETGDSVMYEMNNDTDSFVVNCVYSQSSFSYDEINKRNSLFKAAGLKAMSGSNEVILKSWDLTRTDDDDNKLFESFDDLMKDEIPSFENNMRKKIEEYNEGIIELHEGAEETVTSNKYERNQKARMECIKARGTACMVCGIDFGKAYGPEFAGKIEVHHIVPISEIGEDYVVDPVKDLVPVCPNCHTALHSKKNGVYTVEELKKLRSETGNN